MAPVPCHYLSGTEIIFHLHCIYKAYIYNMAEYHCMSTISASKFQDLISQIKISTDNFWVLTLDCVQVIELPKVKLVARDERMFVASATHLWELKLNDLVYQVLSFYS